MTTLSANISLIENWTGSDTITQCDIQNAIRMMQFYGSHKGYNNYTNHESYRGQMNHDNYNDNNGYKSHGSIKKFFAK